MRWWSGPGGPGSLDVTATPTRVQFLGGSGNAIRNVHVGRSFDLSGAVPRLGADVPRWMGESVGFWDGNALITWTSNIQGWFTHSSWEYSSKLQTIEIWTPRSDPQGMLLGLEHEAVFYDEEALIQPIRNVRFLARQGELNDVTPNNLTHCNQTFFVVNGRATPLVPGHGDPLSRRGSLRPALGRRLGGALRARDAAAEERRHLRLRTRIAADFQLPRPLRLLMRTYGSALASLLLVATTANGQSDGTFVPVTDAMLQNPDPADWLMWRRTLDLWGYSPLAAIDRSNVGGSEDGVDACARPRHSRRHAAGLRRRHVLSEPERPSSGIRRRNRRLSSGSIGARYRAISVSTFRCRPSTAISRSTATR